MMREREQWSSHLGFILASAGAAIGLGGDLEISVRHRHERRRRLLSDLCLLHRTHRPADVDL